jgi:hypothetical protein
LAQFLEDLICFFSFLFPLRFGVEEARPRSFSGNAVLNVLIWGRSSLCRARGGISWYLTSAAFLRRQSRVKRERGGSQKAKSRLFFLSEELNSLLIRGRDMVLSSIPAN